MPGRPKVYYPGPQCKMQREEKSCVQTWYISYRYTPPLKDKQTDHDINFFSPGLRVYPFHKTNVRYAKLNTSISRCKWTAIYMNIHISSNLVCRRRVVLHLKFPIYNNALFFVFIPFHYSYSCLIRLKTFPARHLLYPVTWTRLPLEQTHVDCMIRRRTRVKKEERSVFRRVARRSGNE